MKITSFCKRWLNEARRAHIWYFSKYSKCTFTACRDLKLLRFKLQLWTYKSWLPARVYMEDKFYDTTKATYWFGELGFFVIMIYINSVRCKIYFNTILQGNFSSNMSNRNYVLSNSNFDDQCRQFSFDNCSLVWYMDRKIYFRYQLMSGVFKK